MPPRTPRGEFASWGSGGWDEPQRPDPGRELSLVRSSRQGYLGDAQACRGRIRWAEARRSGVPTELRCRPSCRSWPRLLSFIAGVDPNGYTAERRGASQLPRVERGRRSTQTAECSVIDPDGLIVNASVKGRKARSPPSSMEATTRRSRCSLSSQKPSSSM
jgi:hypothetical protein